MGETGDESNLIAGRELEEGKAFFARLDTDNVVK